MGRAQGVWSSSYMLAFTPLPESRGKSAYHRIELKLPGRAAQVFYRHGYTARPEKLIASEDELKRDVADATSSPVDLTAIPLTLRLDPQAARSSIRSPRFTLTIPPAALEHVESPQGSRYYFSIFIATRNSKGKVLSTVGDKIDSRVRGAGSGRYRQARAPLPGAIRRAARRYHRSDRPGLNAIAATSPKSPAWLAAAVCARVR